MEVVMYGKLEPTGQLSNVGRVCQPIMDTHCIRYRIQDGEIDPVSVRVEKLK